MKHEERVARMRGDEDFMAWLAKYLPDWESENSGSLLGLHDAFDAGRDAQRLDDQVNSDHE